MVCLREWFEGHDRSLEEGLDKRLVDVVNFLQLVVTNCSFGNLRVAVLP